LSDIDGKLIKFGNFGGSSAELPELPEVDDSGDIEMEEELEDEPPEDFNGLTIVLSGTFSKTHDELTALIKKYGGNCVKQVNKTVTHVIASDPSDTNSKLLAARDEGKKIVGEEFLSKVLAKEAKGGKKKKEGHLSISSSKSSKD